MSRDKEDVDAYLARIRKTIEASKALVSQVGLRIAETDRMLERQGLTREQVMAMRFSEAQMAAVDAELKRRGLDPLERWGSMDEMSHAETQRRGDEGFDMEREALDGSLDSRPTASSDAELENRQRKFGLMMKPFQL